MANMKNLYKIYAVLSAIIGVYSAYLWGSTGGSLWTLSGYILISLIFWGGASYLWKLSGEKEVNISDIVQKITQLGPKFLILIGVFIILVIYLVPLYPTRHYGTLTLSQSFILCSQNNYESIHWCIPSHDTFHRVELLDYALFFSVFFGLPLAIGLIIYGIYGIFHKKKI